MSIRDGWASATLRLAPEGGADTLSAELRKRGSVNRSNTLLLIEVEAGPGPSLQRLLGETKHMLRSNAEVLRSRPAGCITELFLGWSPAAPQEALTIDHELIRALDEIGASIVFDTYSA